MTGCAPAPTWEVEMFRGQRERRSDRPAVGPEREWGAPATWRVSASSENNQEQNISRRDNRGEPQYERCNTQGPTGPVNVTLSGWETEFWLVLINAVNGAELYVEDEGKRADQGSRVLNSQIKCFGRCLINHEV